MSDQTLEPVIKALESIETKMAAFAAKAEAEHVANGKVSSDTQTALDNIGIKQRELADELLQIKQKATSFETTQEKDESWGEQFIKGAAYLGFQTGNANRARMEVKNTVTNAIGNTFSERAGFVGGAFRNLTLESILTTLPTTSAVPAISLDRMSSIKADKFR